MSDLVLRPNQQEAVDYILSSDHGRDLVHMPTGSGKTIVFMYISERYVSRGERVLIIVHREHLIQQVLERFAEFYPDVQLGVVRGSEAAWECDVVVASIHTIHRHVDFMPTDFALVVTDEAHRCISPTYMKVYKRLGLINHSVLDELSHKTRQAVDEKGRRIRKSFRTQVKKLAESFVGIESDDRFRKHLGFTATPQRTDNIGLGIIFSGVAYKVKLSAMIAEKRLCDVSILPISFRLDKSELRAMLRDGMANEKCVEVWRRHAVNRRSTIAFCMNINHTESLAEAFAESGVRAAAIHSRISMERRLAIEESFRDGELDVLTNCNVFIEGFDVPHIDCILMARDTDSATLIPQALGRGMRLFGDKEDCLVIDMAKCVDADELARDVDIFGEVKYVSEGNGTGGFKGFRKGEEHPMLQESIFALQEMLSLESDSNWAWVPYLSKNGVALHIDQGVRLTVGKQEDGQFAAAFERGPRWARRSLVCRDQSTIDQAKDACLQYMVAHGIRPRYSSKQNAEWRVKLATTAQIRKLATFGVDVNADCTRGEASDLIATCMCNIGV